MEQLVSYENLRIIDVHTHFPIHNTMNMPESGPRHPLLVAYANERGERMRAEWNTAPTEPAARTDEEVDAALERWAGEVDRYGLDKVVFVSGGGNERLAGLVARHPDKFIGFAHHRLEPGAGAKLRHAVDELGLRGFKQLGPTTDYPFEAPELRDVWEFLAERRLPALIHFGFLGRGGGVVQHPRMSPLSLFEVARDFPEIPFIIPHFGAGYFQDLLALCWSLPNIHIDTSGSNQWMRWLPYPLTLEDLFRKSLETVGAERILFGSDSSLFPRGFSERYLLDQLRACYTLNVHQDDIALIFGGNAARLLQLDEPAAPPAAAKGEPTSAGGGGYK